MAAKRRGAQATLPSRGDILEFIAGSDGKVGKREIARAFGLDATGKIALKRLLREMADDGVLAKAQPRARRQAEQIQPAGRNILAHLPDIDVEAAGPQRVQ